MYQVSEAYRQAITGKRDYRITGEISLKNGKKIPLDESSLQQGTLFIDNQCVNGEELEFGTVYAGQLTMTISSDVDRYSLYDGVVTLSYGFKLPTRVYEEIPLGVYNINEATRSSRYVSIKALDNMVFLDKSFTGQAVNGMPWDILNLISEQSGVALGFTQEFVQGLPNGRKPLAVSASSSIETLRDLLYDLAAILGCFATMDRQGRLSLVPYKKASVLEIQPGFRTSSDFADFTVHYTAIQTAVNKETLTVTAETDDGLTMVLAENAFLQSANEETQTAILESLLAELTAIQYVPASATTYSDPSIELGDMITYRQADGTAIHSLVTNMAFKHGSGQTLKGVGKNPRLSSAKSKSDRQLEKLSGQVGMKDIIFYSFINTKEHSIGTGRTEVINIDFTSRDGTMVEFKASVLLSSAGPADTGRTPVKVTYVRDNVELTTYAPMETYVDGSHTLILYYPMTGLKTNMVHHMQVFLEASAGRVTIGRGNILASVSGQGLAATKGEWDGNITIEQTMGFLRPGVAWVGFSEDLDMDFDSPHERALVDVVAPLNMGVRFVGFTAEITESEVIKSQTMKEFDAATWASNKYVEYDGEATKLRTAYQYVSVAEEIDTGYLCRVTVDTGQFKRVDGIEVTGG